MVTLQAAGQPPRHGLLPMEDAPQPAQYTGEASQAGCFPPLQHVPDVSKLMVPSSMSYWSATTTTMLVSFCFCVQTYLPDLTPISLLRLELQNLDENIELSSTILTSVTLDVVWKERLVNSRVRAYQVRSELEQTFNLLRTTRLHSISAALETQYINMFQ